MINTNKFFKQTQSFKIKFPFQSFKPEADKSEADENPLFKQIDPEKEYKITILNPLPEPKIYYHQMDSQVAIDHAIEIILICMVGFIITIGFAVWK